MANYIAFLRGINVGGKNLIKMNELVIQLQNIGFQNVFIQEGIEADDLIAWLVMNNDHTKSVIVSSDNDLYQLLHFVKSIYTPDKKKHFTELDFTTKYNIYPGFLIEA